MNAQGLTTKPTRYRQHAEQSRTANTHALSQLLAVSNQVSYRVSPLSAHKFPPG
jgi:hypothetical protein